MDERWFPEPVWIVEERNGLYEVNKTDGVIGEHWMKCPSYVDALIVCAVLNDIPPEKMLEIRKRAVEACDADAMSGL